MFATEMPFGQAVSHSKWFVQRAQIREIAKLRPLMLKASG
jgi:hypothetical protein